MTTAISVAAADGAKAVICASTGNTCACAAAYATRAGMICAVLVPDGKIAMGKLSQAIAHGATLLQVDGNFDDCLTLARKLAEAYPVELVNSVNPDRIEGQKTGAFEIVDALGDAPDIHCLPVGNAGNITAYWKGYREYHRRRGSPAPPRSTPLMWGFQAAGAAPIVKGHPIDQPETIATAIRIGNPASWQQAEAARDESGGLIEAVTDEQILAAHRVLSAGGRSSSSPPRRPGSPGCCSARGRPARPGRRAIVCTVTGHGLKDPQWALRTPDGSERRRRSGSRSTWCPSPRPRPGLRASASADSSVSPRPRHQRQPRSGFDRVGLALGLYDDVRRGACPRAGRPRRGHGEGAGQVPDDEQPPRRPLPAARRSTSWARRRPAAPRLPQPHPARPRARLVGRSGRRRDRRGARADSTGRDAPTRRTSRHRPRRPARGAPGQRGRRGARRRDARLEDARRGARGAPARSRTTTSRPGARARPPTCRRKAARACSRRTSRTRTPRSTRPAPPCWSRRWADARTCC